MRRDSSERRWDRLAALSSSASSGGGEGEGCDGCCDGALLSGGRPICARNALVSSTVSDSLLMSAERTLRGKQDNAAQPASSERRTVAVIPSSPTIESAAAAVCERSTRGVNDSVGTRDDGSDNGRDSSDGIQMRAGRPQHNTLTAAAPTSNVRRVHHTPHLTSSPVSLTPTQPHNPHIAIVCLLPASSVPFAKHVNTVQLPSQHGSERTQSLVPDFSASVLRLPVLACFRHVNSLARLPPVQR